VGFVVDIVALGQVFVEYFGFPWQFAIHQLLHNRHLSPGVGTLSQNNYRSTKWTQSHPMRIYIYIYIYIYIHIFTPNYKCSLSFVRFGALHFLTSLAI
jgi:hypothetical protein